MSEIGPQRATPKRLAALKAENAQIIDAYVMPKPEEITIYQETGVCLHRFYGPKLVIGSGVLDTRGMVL